MSEFDELPEINEEDNTVILAAILVARLLRASTDLVNISHISHSPGVLSEENSVKLRETIADFLDTIQGIFISESVPDNVQPFE